MGGEIDRNGGYEFHRPNETSDSSHGVGTPAPAPERSNLRKSLRRAHQIVLTALEVANLRLSRVVSAAEIVDCMLPAEVRWIRKNYAKGLGAFTSCVLGLLRKKGLVFSLGPVSRLYYYGSTTILDPETSCLPDSMSRRRRALAAVYKAVEHFGRAVRVGDVQDYIVESNNDVSADPEFLTRDILNLAETGEIAVVGAVRGNVKGANLYLPSDLNPESYMPPQPLTWLEEVAKAFTEIWEEETIRSSEEKRKPRPIAIGEIRARMAASTDPHPNLDTLGYLPSALTQLTETEGALVRKVARPGKRQVMWAPAGLSDAALDLGDAYASDSERVAEAIRRGCRRLGRPVTVRDVRDEIDMDPALEPAGRSQVRSILSDLSKEMIDAGDGSRRVRVTRRSIYVGKVCGDAYYWHDAETSNAARSYVRFRQIESRWAESAVLAAPGAYVECGLPSVAIGRAMLVRAEAMALMADIDALLRERDVDASSRSEAEALGKQVSGIMMTAAEWLADRDTTYLNIPRDLSLSIPGWTSAELLAALRPLYPPVKKSDSPLRLLTLVKKKIRRFLNPEFERRFLKEPHKASEYLFDRADALLFAATHWGGPECLMQAMIARSEIGYLRDPRFVYPALGSPIFAERLSAVAGLAFLWSDEGNELLRRTAISDSEPGLRQSALWAYGFAGGEGAEALFSQQSETDPDNSVRAFCRKVIESLKIDKSPWWKM